MKKDQAKRGNCRAGCPCGVLGELSAHLTMLSHAIYSVGRCFSMNSWLSCSEFFFSGVHTSNKTELLIESKEK